MVTNESTFRWAALAVIGGCLGISAFYRWRARQQSGTIPRSRECGLLKLGRAVVALPLFVGVFSYIASPGSMAWAAIGLPPWLRWAGLVLGASAVPMALWVFRSIGTNVSETVLTKGEHELVTHGPYRWVRHPLYATGSALFVGIGLMSANGFILVFAIAVPILLRLFVIPIEEQELVRKFDGAYERYRTQTGRLLPRFTQSSQGIVQDSVRRR